MEIPILAREYGYRANASVDLMGGITDGNDPRSRHFERGIKQYPAIGDPAFLLSHSELQTIYDMQASATLEVGQLQQDATITARVNVREMMDKHFALLGSTGVGKSSGVALLLQKILSALPDSAANLLSFLPTLATREVLAFGPGVPCRPGSHFPSCPTISFPAARP